MSRSTSPSPWLMLCGLLVAVLSAMPNRSAAATPVVLVLHNSFVSAEKFQQLQPFATEQGLTLAHLDIDTASEPALREAVASASWLILDVPRPNDRARVSGIVDNLPAADQQPRLIIGGGRPLWAHLDDRYGGALASLYATGGERNFHRFFALIRAVNDGARPAAALLETAGALPATGFYHPDAPRVFTTSDAYLNWYLAAHQRSTNGRVAFVIHRGVVADMLTREIDALIQRTEAANLLPMVFWFDGADGTGVSSLLAGAEADALVNLTHLRDGKARSQDFLDLDIPVIQTLRFRDGEASDWPDAQSGVAPRTTAVFLATPEGWGISDPTVLSATTGGVDDLLPEQADALIAKLKKLVALRHTPAADKKLALMYWNYPAGEKNLGASNLNVPLSLMSIQAALATDGYAVGEPVSEEQVIATGQRLLGGLYGSVPLETLLEDDLAARFPVDDYRHWLASLPPSRRDALLETGDPAQDPAVREIDGRRYFIIPRWRLGHLLVMPQPPRGADPYAHYHDTASVPAHRYLASYLYLQRQYGADALIHLGTHGTQEWLPGKDRGLAASDYPWLAVGDLPVFYPYIQDNVGEAIQAKRRGRAVTISHQTPPFAPAGLYDQLRDLHHLIHEYQQLDPGMVREQVSARIREATIDAHLHEDLGWTAQKTEQDFATFLQQLHDHLHELARAAMPLGLHTFGEPAKDEHRISTVMQQLGEPFYTALGTDHEELFAVDQDDLSTTLPYQTVRRFLEPEASRDTPDDLADFAGRARQLNQHLINTQENEALLAGLEGRFVRPGSGGDPIRNPDVASGRNLYAFEADKIPARAAYDAAGTAYEQLVQAFRAEHDGAWPRKLAFSLWASEAIRHLGVTEAQILHALGLRPVWDSAGRVTELEIIPAAELGRPRTDVVVQVTGVYRDQFDSFMRLLDDALTRLAKLDEPGNPIAINNRRIAAALRQQGLPDAEAEAAARHRLFGNAPGEYGTGVPDLALRSTEWEDDDVLARQFLASSRHAYGGQSWGDSPGTANLLAEQLHGTEAAIMSRSSNLHGVLSTDHPFEFLGGLSSAIRHLDGKAPQLLISDLRGGAVNTTGLDRFLANELRVRYLNPQWIGAMQQEGYAGTLQVLNATNNLFGWQAMDPNTVRDDQWQSLFDTYVTDSRELGTNEWFEQHNPTAQAQMLERMAEAIRKGYWDASEQTRRQLAQRWQTLSEQFEADSGAEVTRRFIADMARGFGLDGGAKPDTAAAPNPARPSPSNQSDAPQAVQGQVMEAVAAESPDDAPRLLWALTLMGLLIGAGALWQARGQRAPRLLSRKIES
ncbi:cobaltochelatase subunit CobN [Alloalcanivorax xenomutans]|uniref:cobaltochelatase subunit CobN n=1 Tax=Alloalcanivorax xenomutans TaxID=1094342 RepID=UPI0024E1D146|nr:cobaltochelatase subunit CobN [Alloalcanivorax xenomutans]